MQITWKIEESNNSFLLCCAYTLLFIQNWFLNLRQLAALEENLPKKEEGLKRATNELEQVVAEETRISTQVIYSVAISKTM